MKLHFVARDPNTSLLFCDSYSWWFKKVTCIAAMLKWFVNDDVAIHVQRNKVLIEEEQVEVQPEFLPDALMDENVDVSLI